MMDRGMNFAMYILVIHRYRPTAFAGVTCHNAQCVTGRFKIYIHVPRTEIILR